MRLFHPIAWWKYSLFLQFSPWWNLWLRYFSGYSFETSRKKASTIFRTQPIHNISIWWGNRRQFLEIFGDNMFTSDALKRGCVIENGWCFFWSSKGITNKMFWLWIPPMGKPDKKAVVSACCGDETTTYHDRAFLKNSFWISDSWNAAFLQKRMSPPHGSIDRDTPTGYTEAPWKGISGGVRERMRGNLR